MTIHLIAADVFAAARRAYADGTLQAVGAPTQVCKYAGPCGIGAALDYDTAAYLDDFSNSTIDTLIESGEVTTDNPGALSWLQRAHDSLSQLNDGRGHVSMQAVSSDHCWDEHISQAQADAAFVEIMGAL
jgi:hypothetical protein